MKIGIISIFPEMFAALNFGINSRAIEKNLISLQYWNPRDYAQDLHRSVDDRPYGGGPGMVMLVQPLLDAINAAKAALPQAKVVYLSPQGKKLNQASLQAFSQRQEIIFVSGRYEGIDERLIELAVDEEWSLGDYVLSGGELAAMVMLDGMIRLLPEALGHADSAQQDSFMDGLLDYPHYTRPEEIAGKAIPEVLKSGNHQKIAEWRLKQALGCTWQRRPELLAEKQLSKLEQKLLNEYISEFSKM